MTTETTRLTYLVHYPRGFANEYDVYAGTPGELDQLQAILKRRSEGITTHRISRREAIRLGVTRPREARKSGEQWFGGFAEPHSNAPYAETTAQKIANARLAALDVIEQGGYARW